MRNALASLAKSCLAKLGQRLPSVAPALQQLAALSREHCRPTAEELQLDELREELDKLQRAAQLEEATRVTRNAADAAAQAAALAAAEANRKTCVVCYDAFDPANGVCCAEGHFMCGATYGDDCLGGHVCALAERLHGVNHLAVQEKEALATGNERRAQQLGGSVFCPVPGCKAAAFSDAIVARHAGEAAVAEHLKAKTLLPIAHKVLKAFESAQTALKAAQAELEGRVRRGEAREAARRLLGQQLQDQLPNARQCRRCSYGPVEHIHCPDLGAHQGERGVDNSCPRCKWFSRDIKDWPKWNGELPADEEEPKEDHPVPDLSAALNMPSPEPRGMGRSPEYTNEGSERSRAPRTAAGRAAEARAAEARQVRNMRTSSGRDEISNEVDNLVLQQVIELSIAEQESLYHQDLQRIEEDELRQSVEHSLADIQSPDTEADNSRTEQEVTQDAPASASSQHNFGTEIVCNACNNTLCRTYFSGLALQRHKDCPAYGQSDPRTSAFVKVMRAKFQRARDSQGL